MPTDINISVGLNLEIGSVPVSLNASYDSLASTYIFDGCVHDAVIHIGSFMAYVGGQFQVEQQLPPELQQIEAIINYIAGQIIYSKKNDVANTEMGISAKFTVQFPYNGILQEVTLSFYADRISGGNHASAYVVGAAIDMDLAFSSLPLLGNIPLFNEYTLKHLGFSYTNASPTDTNPVTFNIPFVDVTDNPLFTRGASDPDAKTAKNYSISTSDTKTNFNLNKNGFAFTAGLMKTGSDTPENNFALPMALQKVPPPNPNGKAQYAPGTTSPPDSPIHWINVNKTIGPVNFQKIGLNYSKGEASFGISASLAVGGFDMDVQGLSITFPLPLPGMPAGNEVSFDIEGLAMDYSKGGLTIGGAFLKTVQGDFTNYFGEVFVQVGEFGFKAIGGYSPALDDKHPAAFFIYAKLDAPLGGPPFLYITGLAFGFGINYGLILPTIDNIATYPLIHDAPAPQGSAKDTLAVVINQLKDGSVIINEPGEYWVAAGLQFTSFDMVTAFALVTVSFGVEVQVALMGTCSIILPEGDPDPVASVEIDLVASITPSTGLFSVLGVITPSSYLLGPFVRISGGFAFFIWFGAGNDPKNDHKGDFVITLGGYHPSFKKPNHYPDVPRIKLTFNLGPLQASGSSYIALTSSMFMAGMQFLATLDAGPLKAWFGAGADFLIGWAPFQYEADAYVNIGCSLDVGLFTLTINIGADLQLWGPPFGGKAELDLVIVSITVHFGSDAAEPAPISWKDLEKNFLPSADSTQKKPPPNLREKLARLNPMDTTANVVTNVSASVVPVMGHDVVRGPNGEVWNWIIDPNDFVITTASNIPSNKAVWIQKAGTPVVLSNDPAKYNIQPIDVSTQPWLELTPVTKVFSSVEVWNTDIHIKPMKKSNIVSMHTITLCKESDPGIFNQYLNDVAIQPVLGKNNTALWGQPVDPTKENSSGLNTNPNAALSIDKSLTGFQIMPLPRNPDTVNSVPLYSLLFDQSQEYHFTYQSAQPISALTVTSSVTNTSTTSQLLINVTGGETESIPSNDFVLNALTNSWVVSNRTAILNDLNNFFNTYADVSLTNMGTTEVLTDWPMIEVLGSPIT